jgi:hypothetical protein
MSSSTRTLALLLLATTVFSCQKEITFDDPGNNGGSNNIAITGDWDFVNLQASTKSVVEVNESGMSLRSVTTSAYLTKNNTGTVTFTASQVQFNNVGYDIDTVMRVQTFLNGAIFDDSVLPFIFSYPPASNSGGYTRNGADSITFASGFAGAPANPSGAADPDPVGARLKMSGDTLLLLFNSAYAVPVTQNGVTGTLSAELQGIMRLKKR